MNFPLTYSVTTSQVDNVELYYLNDSTNKTQVTIVPKFGNNAISLLFKQKELLWFPFDTAREFIQNPRLCGIPLLAPWANRLDGNILHLGDITIEMQDLLGNIKRDDHGLPIHGFLSFSTYWEVTKVETTAEYAKITSKLEFSKYPEYMAQFPFAHELEMSYILSNNELRIELMITNLSRKAMPLHVGFHPYLQLPTSSRQLWEFKIPAQFNHILDDRKLPTVDTRINSYREFTSLDNLHLDDQFSGINPDQNFCVRDDQLTITTKFGRSYPVAVVYAPLSRDVICFEPMTALTNALNDHTKTEKSDPPLRFIVPGEQWIGEFTISFERRGSE